MKCLTKLSAILLAAAMCAAWPAVAQDSSTTTTNAPAKPNRAAQFRGKISAVDDTTKTLTLTRRSGDVKVKITSKTTIKKDGQPAEFSEAVVGLTVSGSGKKDEDGNWTANTLNISTKAPAPKPAAGSTDSK